MIHTQDIQRQFRSAGALHPELDGARYVMLNSQHFTNQEVLLACDYAQRNGDWIDVARGTALEKAVKADMADRDYDRQGRAWTARALIVLAMVVIVALVASHAIGAATVRPAACAGLTGAECTARAEAGW